LQYRNGKSSRNNISDRMNIRGIGTTLGIVTNMGSENLINRSRGICMVALWRMQLSFPFSGSMLVLTMASQCPEPNFW